MEEFSKVLFDEEAISAKVAELGAIISADYRDKDLVLVGIMKGGIIFLSDLTRRIPCDHELDLVGARSYKGGARRAQEVTITKDIELAVEGRDVVLIEDIYDTGNTLRAICDMIRMNQPRSLEVCALLAKRKERSHPTAIKYVGWEIEDAFVVGYGLDYKER